MNKKHKIKKAISQRTLALLIVLLGFAQFSFSQQLNARGTIVDKLGEPIIGASIKVKGTSKGTISDANGKFSIPVTKNAELIISYIGMNQQTVKVANSEPLFINLEASEQSLDEIVVVGYGQSTKRDLTGSMSKVNMDDITKTTTPSITDALGGRIAGLSVTSPDGQPGATANIVIRGSNSLTGDNSPLYVIDGFPIENAQLNSTPPEDIESMEVLKDASATAIYGARGANGVIIITTKRGKTGKPVISYDASYGMQQVTKRIPVMTPYQFVKMYGEIQPTQVIDKYFTNGLSLDSYKDIAGFDFQSAIFHVAPMQSHNLAIRGGTNQTKYSASLNYLDQQGVIIKGGFNRIQGKFTLDQEISKTFKVGVNVGYSQTNSYGVTPSETGFRVETNVMTDVWGYRPVGNGGVTINDSNVDPADAPTDLRFNPLININNAINKKLNNNLNANGYLETNFNTYLKLRISGGINQSVLKNSEFYNSNTKKGNLRNIDGVNGQIIYNENNTWLNENILTYSRTFINAHKLTAMGGITAQGASSSAFGSKAVNCPYESLGLSGLDYGTPQSITSSSSEWTLFSYLGRVNYDYKSKYLVTASFRADGSSKFSPLNKWSYFPSGSLAWRMSEEKFIKNNFTFVSDLKLRTSYGVTGNNRVGDFASLAQMSGAYYYNGTDYTAIIPTQLANTTLRWETTAQANFGLDLGLFAQRVTFTVDAYRKITSNLLLNSQLPPSTGYKTATKNIGTIQNQGLEFTVNSINIKTKDFQWNTNFNISFNQNTVLQLAEGQNSYTTSPGGSSFSPTLYSAIVGQPLAQMVGYVWDKVYQYSDFDVTPAGTYVLKNNVTCNSPSRSNLVQPGYVKFRDLNGDGIINTSDLTVIGNPFPKHIGGFTNNFNYKGFELNIFFQWSYGNDIYNGNRDIFESGRLTYQNYNHFASFDNRWSPDNQTGVFPVARGDYDGNYATTRCVEDGSFLRLKTLSFGYNFNAKLLKKLGLGRLRVYVAGNNLVTWTKYTGYDPEVSSISSSLTPGFDYSTYPRATTGSIGVNASF
jgi:TonB-linked SusC/RagA family outer membrane protein